MKFSLAFLGFSLAHFVSGQELEDIPTTAVNAGSFTTLVAALEAAGLVDTLSAPNGPYTVFAPTDDAFAAIPAALVSCLLLPDNIDALTSILTYHVVEGAVLSTDLEEGTVETLSTELISISLADGVTINDATTVITADIETSNGVIHVIDSVLVPPNLDVNAFLATCSSSGTSAPTDAVTTPVDEEQTAEPGGAAAAPVTDIPTTAVNAGNFETLVAALQAANLVDALADPNGPFTVFAPTDDAFAGIPAELVACLLEPENIDALTSILMYHVVEGTVLSTDLQEGTVETLNTELISVFLADGVTINDVTTVIAADIIASNGVIHVIDSVLVPPSVDVVAFLEGCAAIASSTNTTVDEGEPSEPVDIPTTASTAGVFETLVAALGAADLVSALAEPNGPFTVFAPTDDAFEALPNGLVSCLLQAENSEALTSILTYHVLEGAVVSGDLEDGMTPETLNGETVTIGLADGVVTIDGAATVVTADVAATNGVIHIIDTVLVPSSIDVAAFLENCDVAEPTVEGSGAANSALGMLAAVAVGLLAL